MLPALLRPGALATGALHLVGLRLAPPTARIDVPAGATLLVPIPVQLGDRTASALELAQLVPSGAQLEGTLTGPGLAATLLRGAVGTGLPVPALAQAGDFQITGIRIAKDGQTFVDAGAQTVAIRCLGEVLINSVSSSPMTMDEIRSAGIQLGQGDYVATRFTLALGIGSNQVTLKVPVAIPVYNGLAGLTGEGSVGRLELEGTDLGLPDLHVSLGNLQPPGTLTLARPEIAHLAQHAFKSLVVIPGSIGYLHQFFKVNLVVLNALPKDNPAYAGYKVSGLSGTLDIPAAESSSLLPRSELVQYLRGEAGDGIGPGESASGTWVIEAVREGSHAFGFQVQGAFSGGGLAAPVPILGRAASKVLVRNPTFDLLLVHPEVVRRNETYTLEARLTNTSGAIANGVSVSLDQARLGNVRVVGSASATVDTLRPGETANLKFTLKALRNGEVIASYLYSEAGGIGFQLAVGLGERSVRLNPDTLVLPQTLDVLPESLRESMLRVLGQAWSVATTKGALPPGVWPIPASAVTGRLAGALTEAGLFLRMGVSRERVWAMLWRAFTQNADAGFDQLMRSTEAGQELRTELLKTLAAWGGGTALGEMLPDLARWNLEGGMPVLAAVDGASTGLAIGYLGVDGSGVQASEGLVQLAAPGAAWAGDGDRRLFQARPAAGGGELVLGNNAASSQHLHLSVAAPLLAPGAAPSVNRYDLLLPPAGRVRIPLGADRGPVALLEPSGQAVPNSTADLAPEPFQVLAVHRWDLEMDPKATPFGTHVMVLFNQANQPVQLPSGEPGFQQGTALVQVEGNALWRKAMPINPETGQAPPSPPAVVQALPRIVSVYLERPVGPAIPRALTLGAGWQSMDGQGLAGGSHPIRCGLIPGGAQVTGRVRRPTGENLPGRLTYWHWVSVDEGGVDLRSGEAFEDDYWALISNNIEVGADGAFQFDYIPEAAKTASGRFTLEAATAQGKAFASAQVLGNGQRIDLDIVLEGRGDVFGRLVDGAGVPVAQADVAIYFEQGSAGGSIRLGDSQATRTGADGRFRFADVPAGVFSLRLRKDAIGAARSGAVPAEGGQVDLGDLKLEAASGTIQVTVRDGAGALVANQKVLVGIPAGLLRTGGRSEFLYIETAGTDAQGKVTFARVPAGDVSVRLPAAGGQGPVWYGFLEPGGSLQATLQTQDPKRLAWVLVQVVDQQGAPVVGAGLVLQYDGHPLEWVALTDGEGRATLPAVPDRPFGVIVHHADWGAVGTVSSTLVPTSGGSHELPVTMPPRGFAEGRVIRPDGSPVAGAYVAIPPVYSATVRNRMVRSGPDGRYRIAGLDPGRGERIACLGPELGTAENRAIQGQPEATLTLDLRLPIPGRNRLQGRVLQPGPKQLPAVAEVETYSQLPDISPSDLGNQHWGLPVSVFTGTTRSAPDGSYTIDNLPSGPFVVQASNLFFPDWSAVEGSFEGPAETLVRDLVLKARFAGALEGQVRRPDGFTPAPAGVRVTVRNGAIGELTVETTADGRYAFAKVLPSGDYLLRAEDPASGGIVAEWVKLPFETNLIRNMRLWGKGRLTVKVLDSLGRVLPEGVVSLVHGRQHLMKDGDLPPMAEKLLPSHGGVLVWEDLQEGPIAVELRDPNGLRGLASAEIPMGGGDAEVTVQLQPVGSILGLLKRPDGSSVPAGRVDAYQGSRWLGLSNSRQDGVDGRFRFVGLPTGTVVLEAWDPDTRQTGKATVQVREDQTTELVLTTNDLGTVDIRVRKDGNPVARATVQVQYRSGPALAFSAESTTDPEGRAAFQLPPGSFGVQGTDPVSLATGAADFVREPGQPPLQVDLALSPTRDLRLAVQPPRGYSGTLAGWRVRASRSALTAQRLVTLAADGTGTLPDLMPGTYTLELYDAAGRYRGSRTQAVVLGTGPQDAALPALARGQLEITLVDAHGAPVTNGRVEPFGPWDPTTYLAAMGTDLEGKVRIASILEGRLGGDGRDATGSFRARGETLLQSEGELATLVLTLEPSARFTGVLSTAGGAPVPWTLVNVRRVGAWLASQLATDGAGRFTAPELPLGTYQISADDGHGRVGSRSILLDTPDQVAVADFILGGSAVLRGTVRDPLRDPVPPVSVEAWLGNALFSRVAVDGAGAYRIPDLPTQRAITLRVRMDDGATLGHQSSLTLATDGAIETLDLQLDPLPSLRGHTFAEDGSSHRSMSLQLLDAAGSPVRKGSTSADHPDFRLDYLAPGSYQLRGYDQVQLLAHRAVTVSAAPVLQTADLVALPMRDLALQLRWPDGSACAASGRVRMIPVLNPGGAITGDLDGSGALLLRGVALGDIRLEVTGVANQPTLVTTATIAAGPGPQAIDIPTVGEGSVRLFVRTAAGRLLTGGTATIQTSGSPVWTATPQPDGSLLASRVWAGRPLVLQGSGFGTLGLAPTVQIPGHGAALEVTWPAPDQGGVQGTVRNADGSLAAGATVGLDGIGTRTADAAGAFRFDGLPVGGTRTLRAEAAGASPEWTSTPVALTTDTEVKNRDLTLPGVGTVVVRTLDRRGDPLPGSAVTVITQNRQADRIKHITTDAAGVARLEGMMAAAVRAQATLEGRPVTLDGSLTAGGELQLDLKAPDATRILGAVRRAKAAVAWPAGTTLLVNGQAVALNPDGGLASDLDQLYTATPLTLAVPLPAGEGGRRFELGTLPMVRNGDTVIDLQASGFGTIVVNVQQRDGSAAAAAHLQGEGGLRVRVDAAGRARFPALDLGARTFFAVLGERAGQAAGTLAEDGQVLELTLPLSDRLDVSGRYRDNLGTDYLLFQDGPRVFGNWSGFGASYRLEGTLIELQLQGDVQRSDGVRVGALDVSVSADGRSFSGDVPGFGFRMAQRQPGIDVVIEPPASPQRAGSTRTFKALVAGTADKAVAWAASAGHITADGAFTAPADPGPVTLTARSSADPERSASTTVQVRPPITLSPASLVLQPGQSATVTATLTGVEAADLVWSASGGSLVPAADNLGARYTAPTASGATTLTVYSCLEPEVTASLPISVVAGAIVLSPASGQVYAGESFQVSASVSGLADTTLTWTSSAGTVTGTGLVVDFRPPYPSTPGYADGPVTLTVTSTSNPAVKATATFQMVRRGSLLLRARTASTRLNLPNRMVNLNWPAGGASQGLSSVLDFSSLPIDTPITLKDSASEANDPWNPPMPGQTFTLASGEAKTVEAVIPFARPILHLKRDGIPLEDVGVSLYIETVRNPHWGWWYQPRTGPDGSLDLGYIPMNVPVDALLAWQNRILHTRFTVTEGDPTVAMDWPTAAIAMRVLRGGVPVQGVQVGLTGTVEGWNEGTTDAEGRLRIADLPLGAPLQVRLYRHPVEQSREVTLTGPETTLEVEWPPLSSVTVRLQRQNGRPLPAEGWQWSASPGNETWQDPGGAPESTWPTFVQGYEQRIVVSHRLDEGFDCGGSLRGRAQGRRREERGAVEYQPGTWGLAATLTPTAVEETHTFTLPALAAVRVQFQDASGQPLTGSLEGDRLSILAQTSLGQDWTCNGPARDITTLDPVVFPEIFTEGNYQIAVFSQRWGALPPTTCTIGPDDDGAEKLVTVTLPWVRTELAIPVRAGDHATPVPNARLVATRADGGEVELARTLEEATEAGFTGGFYGPEEDLQVQARFTTRRSRAVIVSPSLILRPGGTWTASLEIPLTVVRTRLLDPEHEALEGQGLLAKETAEAGTADECPTVRIDGARQAVLLGEPVASAVELGLYDPDSGLGRRQAVTVPALGARQEVELPLASHAWLDSASLATVAAPAAASRLLLALGADTTELVQPAAASWLLAGGRFAPLRQEARLRREGLQPWYWAELAAALVADPADPPVILDRTLGRVRIPRAASLWAAEHRLQAWEYTTNPDGSVATYGVDGLPGRWGRVELTAEVGAAIGATVPESTPVWKATPLRILDAAGQPPVESVLWNLRLIGQPAEGPAAWRIPLPVYYQQPEGPDSQGVWRPLLPIGLPVHVESAAPDCGEGTWPFGLLEFVPTDPPPSEPPVLRLDQVRPRPVCPPSAGVQPKAQAAAPTGRPTAGSVRRGSRPARRTATRPPEVSRP